MQVITSPAEMRAAARRGEWRGSTGGQCAAYQQANLVVLPKEAAVEFAAFCTRNPKPCPLIEITPPGVPEPARAAPGADLRTDLPGYRVYRDGELVAQRDEIRDLWRDDLVAFLLGCSLTFEHALMDAGVGVRHVECGTLVPMFISNLACRPAGRFHGPMVVTMRPIPEAQVQLAGELTARYPHAHGAPLHSGNPEAIGIADLGRPDYGDPVAIHPGEVPVFWACGVTPQAVALEARPELMITHEPGSCSLLTCLATGMSGRECQPVARNAEIKVGRACLRAERAGARSVDNGCARELPPIGRRSGAALRKGSAPARNRQ